MSRSRSRFGSHADGGRKRARHQRDDPDLKFRCCNCRLEVGPASSGSKHRNHCPSCLFSQHLDHSSGDRRANCGARMEPIAIEVRQSGEWALIHRCQGCGELGTNRIASDDNEFVLMQLATRPIAFPAFPLEPLTRNRGESFRAGDDDAGRERFRASEDEAGGDPWD